jgi:hypothetical protein
MDTDDFLQDYDRITLIVDKFRTLLVPWTFLMHRAQATSKSAGLLL